MTPTVGSAFSATRLFDTAGMLMPIDHTDAAHLLRRVGFGGTAADAAALAAASADRASLIATFCATTTSPPAVLPALSGEAWSYTDMVNVRNWWFERMRTTPAPFLEKVVLFWHSFFATRSCGFVARDADLVALYRARGLGSFRDLIQSVAIHPAMLDYLNARSSTKWSPNQNFARELLELYTVGTGSYTQSDVVAASRAWTGWRVDDTTGAVTFRADYADDGIKTFMGAPRAWNGPEIIDFLCSDPRTKAAIARRLSFKAWVFFGTPNASDAARKAVADALVASDLNIAVGLRALFSHAEFWAPSTRQGLVRTPVEYVVAALRATGVPAAEASPGDWRVDMTAMGQELFYAPNVGGWPANLAWLSPSANLARQQFCHWLTSLAVPRGFLVATRSMSVAAAVETTASAFGISDRLTTATRQALIDFLTTQRAASKPTNDNADLRGLITIALLSPEFTLA